MNTTSLIVETTEAKNDDFVWFHSFVLSYFAKKLLISIFFISNKTALGCANVLKQHQNETCLLRTIKLLLLVLCFQMSELSQTEIELEEIGEMNEAQQHLELTAHFQIHTRV